MVGFHFEPLRRGMTIAPIQFKHCCLSDAGWTGRQENVSWNCVSHTNLECWATQFNYIFILITHCVLSLFVQHHGQFSVFPLAGKLFSPFPFISGLAVNCLFFSFEGALNQRRGVEWSRSHFKISAQPVDCKLCSARISIWPQSPTFLLCRKLAALIDEPLHSDSKL